MGELISSEEQQTVLEKCKVTTPLNSFPLQVLDHAATLQHLDLSGTGLSSLPDAFGQLKRLKVAFFSNCNFSVFPKQLAACAELEMVAFRSNHMREIPEDALPERLRWLILTNNEIDALPRSIGKCSRLQKCMLSGNKLRSIPGEMSSCRKLGLLRLSANNIEVLPGWLFEMPELAFLSFAGNPCASEATRDLVASSALPSVSWSDIEVQELLGEGASGIISKARWVTSSGSKEVAVKLFKGDVTSDGTPLDEMRACINAGSHQNLIDPLGEVEGHPDKKGLILQLIPPVYTTLGLPPSLETCTRDCFSPTSTLRLSQGLGVLQSIASAAAHLHARGVAHGDLYAHNILYDSDGHALLGDFGAASLYKGCNVQQLEVLAFAHLIQDVRSLIKLETNEIGSTPATYVLDALADLQKSCSGAEISGRPSFTSIEAKLKGLQSPG